MEALQIQWSRTRQEELHSQLMGFWAQDEWEFSKCPLTEGCVLPKTGLHTSKTLQFKCISSSLNTEIKYALWKKLEQGFSPVTLWIRAASIRYLMEWLNTVAANALSFLDRSLASWELSLRSYLVERGKLNEPLATRRLNKNQEIRHYRMHSIHLTTFRQIYKFIQDAYDERPEYEKEIWDLRKLGVAIKLSKSEYKLNFTKISQPWLLQTTKKFIRYSLSIYSVAECSKRINALNDFSVFIEHHHPLLQPSLIDRPLILEYLSQLPYTGISEGTRCAHISCLRTFLELCTREGWIDVPERRLIYSEDFPRIPKTQPRYIPEEVMSQLNQHIEALPPQIMRMVLVLQEVGMRIGELCELKKDCLIQDNQGDWFLRYYQFKMKKEHSVPVSTEVTNVIKEQQKIVNEKIGKDCPYLFPNRKGQPVKHKPFTDALNRLSYEKNICNLVGTIWHFQSHQFRHTVGTRMINSGVPHHIVQRYLGHESPEMTNRYAHIHDQTLKEEYAKFKGKIVDVTGRVVSHNSVVQEMASGSDPNGIDDQWIKKNILAQALPNGLCGLPVVQKACPYGANRCLTGPDGKGCSHFKTDTKYLDQHKDHLERTNKIVEWAQENPDSRRSQEILKENLPVQENLKRIIASIGED